MNELIQITAQYSNAVLVAIMPHISDFAKKLDLPIPTPVTVSQVASFKCSPRQDDPGGKVVLTNGYEFAFISGRIGLYRSPLCYFFLQDPDRVPEFFGPVRTSREQGLQIARAALKTLGYTNESLRINQEPEITEPPKSGTNFVPRYRFTWSDSDSPSLDGKTKLPSVDIEVDACTKQIHMLYLLSAATWRPHLAVDGYPALKQETPRSHPAGTGRKIVPVSQAYSNAFITAILPQVSDYVEKTGFAVKTPITVDQLDMSRCICGLIEGDPYASLFLKSGYRFHYGHGQVTACYAADASYVPGQPQKRVESFYGPLNLNTNQAIAFVRQIAKRLNYAEKALRIDEAPYFANPFRKGTNTFARYFLNWREPNGPFRVVAEVDATNGKLKSLYINDRANTNIWRQPPKIEVPLTMEANSPN